MLSFLIICSHLHAQDLEVEPGEVMQLDVAFVIDTTSSMGSLIEGAKQNINSTIIAIKRLYPNCELRLALIGFRDRGDRYLTKLLDFQTNETKYEAFHERLWSFRAVGGGDTPEDVNTALYEAVHELSWSELAEEQGVFKQIFLVGDAPPHMDYDQVQYPEILQTARDKNILVSAFLCGGDHRAREHWEKISQKGSGEFRELDCYTHASRSSDHRHFRSMPKSRKFSGATPTASPEDPGHSIAISLGRETSAAGVFRDLKVEYIPDENKNAFIHSYIAFTDTEYVIGEAAKKWDPTNTITGEVLTLLGRDFSHPSVTELSERVPYKIIEASSGKPEVEVNYKGEKRTFSPQEILTMLCTKLKTQAEAHLGEKVSNKVAMTVPVYFNDAQRMALKDVARKAGLDVIRFIHEPIASALAYGLDKNCCENKNILIIDVGRTLDTATLQLDEGVFDLMTYTYNESHVMDFNSEVAKYVGIPFKGDVHNQKLLEEVTRATQRLKSADVDEVSIEVESLEIHETMSRGRFAELNKHHCKYMQEQIGRNLKESDFEAGNLDFVVITGGSSKYPGVIDCIQEFLGVPDSIIKSSLNPHLTQVHGAAVLAGILHGSMDDDALRDVLLIDVTPLSLQVGIQHADDFLPMMNLIPRNSVIPNKKSHRFETKTSTSRNVTVNLYQGEYEEAEKNIFLGKIELVDVDVEYLDVTIEIDANGIITLNVADESLTISPDLSTLSEDVIEEMLWDIGEFDEDDLPDHDSLDDFGSAVLETLSRSTTRYYEERKKEDDFSKEEL